MATVIYQHFPHVSLDPDLVAPELLELLCTCESDILNPRIKTVNQIGAGTFSKVYRFNQWALKMINDDSDHNFNCHLELNILHSLRHPHIIHGRGLVVEKNRIGVVLPYYQMDFYWLTFERLHCDKIAELGLQILDGLEFLHAKNILHLDITPANMLYDTRTNTAVLSDFSNSNIMVDGQVISSYVKTTCKCRPLENFTPDSKGNYCYTPATDVWSLCMSLCSCIEGELITFLGSSTDYDAETQRQLLEYQRTGFSFKHTSIFHAGLIFDPTARPSLLQIRGGQAFSFNWAPRTVEVDEVITPHEQIILNLLKMSSPPRGLVRRYRELIQRLEASNLRVTYDHQVAAMMIMIDVHVGLDLYFDQAMKKAEKDILIELRGQTVRL